MLQLVMIYDTPAPLCSSTVVHVRLWFCGWDRFSTVGRAGGAGLGRRQGQNKVVVAYGSEQVRVYGLLDCYT